ncbi:MAG: hypothetical protein J6Q13_02490 [Clostridia bacterium]|nr:hypothetical protein [Clostridia bacterium]
MKVEIKKEVIEKFLKDNNLTKNKFCSNAYISVKTFNKFMRGEKVRILIALKIATYMEVEYEELFDWE